MFKLRKKFFTPEIIQVAATDCGPACLKSICSGFGVDLSYDKLRTFCKTDIDGSSIDDMEQVLLDLGFSARQQMIPFEHMLQSKASDIPAISIVRLPGGVLHYIVIWKIIGNKVQIMDPAHGRHWIPLKACKKRLYNHEFDIDAQEWYDWAQTKEFLGPLSVRLDAILGSKKETSEVLRSVISSRSIIALCGLEASLRFIEGQLESKSLSKDGAKVLLFDFVATMLNDPKKLLDIIDKDYWYAFPLVNESREKGRQIILMQSPVILSIGTQSSKSSFEETESSIPSLSGLKNKGKNGIVSFYKDLMVGSGVTKWLIALTLFIMGIVAYTGFSVFSGFVFKALTYFFEKSGTAVETLKVFSVLVALPLFLFLIDLPLSTLTFQFGRKLEGVFRVKFYEKLPLIKAEYFETRLNSDLINRLQKIYDIKRFAELAKEIMLIIASAILTCYALYILFPSGIELVLLLVLWLAVLCGIKTKFGKEKEMSLLNHSGGLMQYNLDGIKGSQPLAFHSSRKSFGFIFKMDLAKWQTTFLSLEKLNVRLDAIIKFAGTLGVVLLTYKFLQNHGASPNAFLFTFWSLTLLFLVENLTELLKLLSNMTASLERLRDPIYAEEEAGVTADVRKEKDSPQKEPIRVLKKHTMKIRKISFESVTIKAANTIVVEDLSFTLNAKDRVALVGASGAGKSTIINALLGWNQIKSGEIYLNDRKLDSPTRQKMIKQTAWIDQEIALWDNSLLYNISYGLADKVNNISAINTYVVDSIISKLPNGLLEDLKENGGSLSGGEAQRVRICRAINKHNPGLVLMDEPFRGLEFEVRQDLLELTLQHWNRAIVICALHDISLTKLFDRVLLIDNGKLVEDGHPHMLLADPNSRLSEFMAKEGEVNNIIWNSNKWKKFELKDSRFNEITS